MAVPKVFPVILTSRRLVIDFLSEVFLDFVCRTFLLMYVLNVIEALIKHVYEMCKSVRVTLLEVFIICVNIRNSCVCLMLSIIIVADHKRANCYQLLLSVFEPLSLCVSALQNVNPS